MRRAAVFLDRDGTVVDDVDYLTSPDRLRLLPGAARALRKLRSAGLLLIVTTNQSAVARGRLTEPELRHIHRTLNDLLREEGAGVDDFFYCPHLPGGRVAEYAVECSCRKPKPGLLRRAAEKWNVDLSRSFAVGDSERDVQAGRAAGCFSILISECPEEGTGADAAAKDLEHAADLILRRRRESE